MHNKFLGDLWNWYPPVGVFIATLALLAAIVPMLRDFAKMGPREKLLWTVVVFALCLLEIRSVYLDRNKHDREQAQARTEELRKFDEIARGIQATIEGSQKQFDATISGIRQNINTITGGKSFCYLVLMSNGTRLIFVHSGDYPLADVNARIVDLKKFNQITASNPNPSLEELQSADTYVQVGDLAPHSSVMPRGTIQLAGQSNSFNIFFVRATDFGIKNSCSVW